jgi:hypothetical protein
LLTLAKEEKKERERIQSVNLLNEDEEEEEDLSEGLWQQIKEANQFH